MFGFWKRAGGRSGAGGDSTAGEAQDLRAEGVEKVRERMVFHGRVQGVGFRFTASRIARELGLTGWVHNRMDGAVEAEVQGGRQAIEDFLLAFEDQPYIAIRSVDRERIPVVSEKTFRVEGYVM